LDVWPAILCPCSNSNSIANPFAREFSVLQPEKCLSSRQLVCTETKPFYPKSVLEIRYGI
jgi:hypothetical protein